MPGRLSRGRMAAVIVIVCALVLAWLLRGTFPEAPAKPHASARAGRTLIVHITGLLVIVPPDDPSGTTHIVMPPTTGIPDHHPRLAFRGDNTDLCERYNPTERRCTVNMERWSLEPLGVGGTIASSTMEEMPRGVIDLAAASKNEDGVNLRAMEAQGRILARFASGRAVNPACSLATWYFDPVGLLNQGIVPVANVLDWEIHLPLPQIELVFKRKTQPYDTRNVVLPTSGPLNQIFLTHDPESDVSTGRRAGHFAALYNALDHSGEHERPMPLFLVKLRSGPCPAPISRRQATTFVPPFTVDTYSCLLAAAKPKGGEL